MATPVALHTLTEAPTNEELIVQHRVAAEAYLRRAERSHDVDAAARWASMATSHAVLALTYMTRPTELDDQSVTPLDSHWGEP